MLWRDFGGTEILRDFQRLQDEMNRLFAWTAAPSWTAEVPPINVWVGSDRATVTAEIPGVDPSDIDISVSGETLTIRGERKPYELKSDETYHRRERTHGTFVRTITLPFRPEVGSVDASFRHGLLYIALPRAEADRPKKIAVKAS
jgi:HSP20 family protein